MDCESRHDLIIQLVLGTLPQDEAMEVRADIERCPVCAAFAEETRISLGALAASLKPLAPSPDVKQRLMERVRPATSMAMPMPSAAGGGTRGSSRFAWLLAAAAVLAVGIGATLFVRNTRQAADADRLALTRTHQDELGLRVAALAEAQQRSDDLAAELNVRETDLGKVAADLDAARELADARLEQIEQLADRLATEESLAAALRGELELSELVVAALQGQDAVFISLSNTPDAEADESARILLDPSANRWYLFTVGLPPLPADRIYQFWFIKDGTPVPVNTFAVNDEGRGLLYGEIPTDIGDYQLAGITAEPAGGSPAPTTPVRILGSLH